MLDKVIVLTYSIQVYVPYFFPRISNFIISNHSFVFAIEGWHQQTSYHLFCFLSSFSFLNQMNQ